MLTLRSPLDASIFFADELCAIFKADNLSKKRCLYDFEYCSKKGKSIENIKHCKLLK